MMVETTNPQWRVPTMRAPPSSQNMGHLVKPDWTAAAVRLSFGNSVTGVKQKAKCAATLWS